MKASEERLTRFIGADVCPCFSMTYLLKVKFHRNYFFLVTRMLSGHNLNDSN